MIAGFISTASIKGGRIPTREGILFHNSMVVAILDLSIVSLLLSHFNPFLPCIGIFSLYDIIRGRPCLMVNKSDYQLKIDTYHAYILILNCLLKIVVTINSRPNKHYFNRIWQPRHSGGYQRLKFI